MPEIRMDKTEQEQLIEQEAIAFAKKHRNDIARRLTDPTIFVPEKNPVSVFMAGSPGAGKTEASLELLALKGADGGPRIQRAVIRVVERMHDLALKQKQSFLLDGTLSSYDVANKNVHRSLDKKRTVQILYVYQEPEQAWKFVQAREAAEGRRINADDFVREYFAARVVVNRLKAELGKAIQVDLLMKNNDGSQRFYRAGVDQIDNHIPEKYSEADVRHLLGLR
jgi:UDP-N-acetylglucosamine kinase